MKTYTDRNIYRRRVLCQDLASFQVLIKETDMMVMAESDLSAEAYDITLGIRLSIEAYIRDHPEFRTSLVPLEIESPAPAVVRSMAAAADLAGVGPMAAVAGAVAQALGEALEPRSETVVVENGGDIYLRSRRERVVAIYAGRGPAEFNLGIRLPGAETGVGVCTSSGRIGPSWSAGTSRAATVVAASAPLADAAATALGNRLGSSSDIGPALAWLKTVPGVFGGVAIHGKVMGACGDIDLVNLPKND